MRLAFRWLAAGVGSGLAFVVVWLVLEYAAGLNAGQAQTYGGFASAFALTYLGWWAPRARPALGAPHPRHRESTSSATSVPVSGSSLRKPIVVGHIPEEPPGYQPRHSLFAQLTRFAPDANTPVLIALTGMIGTGKTLLAAAYARKCQANGWRFVAWISAEDEASILSSLAAVAFELKLRRPSSDAETAGRAVRQHLESDGAECLMVFDSVRDFDVIHRFIPTGGKSHILITTNSPAPSPLGDTVEVGVFTQREALAFLRKQSKPGSSDDPSGAKELADQLGYLPLALAQAAAVIGLDYPTYTSYLQEFRDYPVEEYLRRVKGQSYPLGAATAILLSLQSIRTHDQLGLCDAIMNTISVLARQGTPRELLYEAGRRGMLEAHSQSQRSPTAGTIDQALGRLARSSLITFNVNIGVNVENVSAHRLVMRVVRDRMLAEEHLTASLLRTGTVLVRYARSIRQRWNQFAVRDVVEQIHAFCGHAAPCLEPGNPQLNRCALELRLEMARFLDDLGDKPAAAVESGGILLLDCERDLGIADSCTLAARHNLAIALQQAGRYPEAIDLYEINLAIRARTLGTRNPDTLTSRNNLATAYQDAGDYVKAIELYRENLGDRIDVLGDEHPDVLASRNNLATAYLAIHQVDDAIALLEVNVKNVDRTVDVASMTAPDGSATSNIRSKLDSLLHRPRHGEVLYEKTRADGKREINQQHPDALCYVTNLGAAYLDSGHLTTGLKLLESALSQKKQNLGLYHPSTLISENDLAAGYMRMGRRYKASGLLKASLERASLESSKQVLGREHEITSTLRRNRSAARLFRSSST